MWCQMTFSFLTMFMYLLATNDLLIRVCKEGSQALFPREETSLTVDFYLQLRFTYPYVDCAALFSFELPLVCVAQVSCETRG